MAGTFKIPITYKGQELTFNAELQKLGYTYKILVDVNGVNVTFELDDEGQYRALMDTNESMTTNIDIGLVKIIGEALHNASA